MRKAQMGNNRGEYAWIAQVTAPHARGAGRYTFFDLWRSKTKEGQR